MALVSNGRLGTSTRRTRAAEKHHLSTLQRLPSAFQWMRLHAAARVTRLGPSSLTAACFFLGDRLYYGHEVSATHLQLQLFLLLAVLQLLRVSLVVRSFLPAQSTSLGTWPRLYPTATPPASSRPRLRPTDISSLIPSHSFIRHSANPEPHPQSLLTVRPQTPPRSLAP